MGEEDEEDEENEENDENKEEDGGEQYRKHSSLIDIEGSPVLQIDCGKAQCPRKKLLCFVMKPQLMDSNAIITLLMQKMNEALEEIEGLKQKLGQLLAALPANAAVVPYKNESRAELYPLVPSSLCKTKKKLEHLSVLLKDGTGDVVPQFMAAINNIGRQNPADETRNIMEAVMTNDLAKVCSWAIDGPPPKTADPEIESKREPKLIFGESDMLFLCYTYHTAKNCAHLRHREEPSTLN
ncbi:hypothetical protein QAD02_011909 [Eretmocerus hayati]|uniref:Uncharacterized protein n=1 Tax=Eretmocerus hayati TaxID=131215 RepID=A0ACC2NZ34_9HYME|nr:hypothetical protein QAD02_011909 [Eretmocerus hayati]